MVPALHCGQSNKNTTSETVWQSRDLDEWQDTVSWINLIDGTHCKTLNSIKYICIPFSGKGLCLGMCVSACEECERNRPCIRICIIKIVLSHKGFAKNSSLSGCHPIFLYTMIVKIPKHNIYQKLSLVLQLFVFSFISQLCLETFYTLMRCSRCCY